MLNSYARKLKTKYENKIQDHFVTIVKNHFSLKDTKTVHNDVFLSLPSDTPKWLKEYIEGYFKAYLDMIYKDHIELCYIIDGEYYSTDEKSDRHWFEKVDIEELNPLKTAYLWKNSNDIFEIV